MAAGEPHPGATLKRPVDPDLRRAARLGLLIGLWVGGIGLAAWVVVLGKGGFGLDSHAYWAALQTDHPYGASPGTEDAYLYSPVFHQVLRPLGVLPWPVFGWLWAGAEAFALLWLIRPLGWVWAVPALLLSVNEIQVGNVRVLLAAALVAGFTAPVAWSFLPLTKVGPALPVAVWLAVRREWRPLAAAASWCAGIVLLSAGLDQRLWSEWLGFLADHGATEPWVWARLVAAVALAVVAASRGWVWALPLAIILAIPTDGLVPSPLALFAAVPRLLQWQRGTARQAVAAPRSHDGRSLPPLSRSGSR